MKEGDQIDIKVAMWLARQGPHLTWKKQQVGWGTRLPYGQHKGVLVCLITKTLIGEFARSTERQTLRG